MTNETPTAECPHGVAIACDYGIIYPLTPCCRASGKGGEWGVMCRACYAPLPIMFGDCATVEDIAPVPGWFHEQGRCGADAQWCAATTLAALHLATTR